MNTTMITTVLLWEKELEIQKEAAAKRRYSFGVEEPADQPCQEVRRPTINWRRPQPVCERRPQAICECA